MRLYTVAHDALFSLVINKCLCLAGYICNIIINVMLNMHIFCLAVECFIEISYLPSEPHYTGSLVQNDVMTCTDFSDLVRGALYQ